MGNPRRRGIVQKREMNLRRCIGRPGKGGNRDGKNEGGSGSCRTTTRSTFTFQKKVDLELRGWSHRALCLLTGHGPFRGYFKRFNLKAGAEECSCGEGPETAEHVVEECQLEVRRAAREQFRRDQEQVGGSFPFQVSRETKRAEISNFNRFAAQVVLEEEMEALGRGGNVEGLKGEAEEEEEEEEEEEDDHDGGSR